MMMMMSRTIYPVKLQQKVGFSKNTDKTRILRRGGGRRRPRFKSEEGEKGRGERRVLLLRTTTTSNSNSSIKDGAFKEEDKEEEEKPLLSGTAIKRIAGEDVDVSTEQKKLSRAKARKKTKETVEFDANFCNVVTRYDPEAIRREALRRPAKLVKRVLFLTQKFSKLNGKRKELERIDRSTAEKSADGVTNDRLWAKEVKTTLTSLGPLFVKLGQNLANRPDLVPEDVMEELTTLQDKVPAFPTSEAREIMESQWGEKIDDVFETFTKEPVAAASIGQVYRGTLKKDKRDVAIKVLRPNTRDSVILDLFVLRAAAKQLFDNFCLENVGCPATLLVDEFAEKLLEELDFIQEGRNLRDFRNNFADDPSVHTYPRSFQNSPVRKF